MKYCAHPESPEYALTFHQEPPAFDPCVTQRTGTNTFHQRKRFGVSFEEWSRVSSWHVATRKSVRGAAAARALLAQKVRSMEAVRAGRGLASSVSGAPCPLIHRSSSSRWHHHDRERILENDADVVPHDSLRCNTVFIRRDSHEEPHKPQR